MTELGPEAKRLLEAARDGDEPTPESRTRVREALAAHLLSGAAVAHIATAAKSSSAAAVGTSLGGAGGAGASLGVAAKVVLSLALLSAIAIGGSALVRSTQSAGMSARPSVGATPPTRAEPQPARSKPVSPPAASPTASEVPTRTEASSPVRPAFAARSPALTNDVEAEVRLIERAHVALRGGDALPALLLLDEHARRFPSGALAEERDATRVLALCALGRTAEAHAAAGRFLRGFPHSPHAERVGASCGAAP